MSDIVQSIGFDIGNSVASVQALSVSLAKLSSEFTSCAAGMKAWNTEAKDMAKLATLGDKVNRLTNQYNALAKAQAKMKAGPATQTGPSTTSLQSQLSLVKQLTNTWGTVPKTNPLAQQFAQMQASAAKFAAVNKMTAVDVATAFTSMGTAGNAATRALGAQFAQLSAVSAKAMSEIKTSSDGITIALSSMLKYKAFSMVMASIASLVTAFKEGTAAAAAFSRQLGMIETVAGGADMGNIEKQLLGLSRTFGTPIEDVSSAYYLTLQNQVGDAAESMNVLAQAEKVAAATGSSLTDVVDTLTVSIAGFKLKAADAGNVTGKLFKAMEIGRFQFSDMKDTMGRVDSIASDLGVSLSEVLGPIATMTRQGVRFDTAVTQMRAVMSQTLKPTKELKQVFEDWGVEGVEQAISKWGGLLPMLKATENYFKGNSAAMAKAFTNLRAFTGMMSMLGANYEQTQRDTKKIEAANESVADKVFGIFDDTPGQKYNKLLNEIKLNFMEIGKVLLPVVAGLAQITAWGSSNATAAAGALVGVMVALTATVIAATVAYTGLQTASIAAATASIAAWKTTLVGGAAMLGLQTAGLFAVGFLAGLAAMKLWDWMTGGAEAAKAEFMKIRAEELKWQADKEADLHKAAQKELEINKRLTDGIIGLLTQRQKAHKKIADDTAMTEKASLKVVENALDYAVGLQQKKTEKLFSLSQGEDQDSLLKNISDATTNAKNKEFDYKNSQNKPAEQAAKQLMRSDSLRYEALSKLRTANSKEEFDAIRTQIDSADQYAQSAGSAAGSLGDKRFADRAAKASVVLAKDKANIAQAEYRANQKAQSEAIKGYPEQLKLLTKLASLRDRMVDSMKTAGKTDEQIAAGRKTYAEDSKEFTKLLEQGGAGKSGIGSIQKLMEQMTTMATQMPALDTRVNLIYKDSMTALTADFEKLSPEVKVKFKLDKTDPFGSMMGIAKNLQEELAPLLDRQVKQAGELAGANNVLKTRLGDPNSEKSIAGAVSRTEDPERGTKLREVDIAYNNLLEKARTLASTPITPENLASKVEELRALAKAREDYAKAESQAGGGTAWLLGADQVAVLKNVQGLTTAAQQEISKLNDTADFSTVATRIAEIKGQLETLRQEVLVDIKLNVPQLQSDQLDTVHTAIDNINLGANLFTSVLTGSVTPAASSFADQMVRAADAGRQLANYVYPIPPMPVVPTQQAMGGFMRFAKGGRAQGTDTIPAMLSPGEFVMNAKSTRRYFSQLVAMNSGVKPIHRQDGGSVTNVGDINVSVNGGSTSRQSARDIATALRREMRRGTARL